MDDALPPRTPPAQIVKATDTRDVLAHAARQARQRRLEDYLIIDVDAHHFETSSWPAILDYVPDPVIQDIARNFTVRGQITPGILRTTSWPFHQTVAGRITHDGDPEQEVAETDVHRDVTLVRRAIDCLGIDTQVVFPTPMLGMGMHPEIDVEVALSHGYNRWLCDTILPADDRIKSLLYLPFNEPEACERFVEEFAERKGVVGFMVTSARYKPVHHNAFMRLYAMLEERGLPLAFHAGPYWGKDGFLSQMNRFLSAHAISFPLGNMVHLANWVMNGLPERFPKLKVIWVEAGVTWMAFMTTRFDNEYLMRVSEAPALKRLPSEYMREMFYTTQPMERTNLEVLEATFNAIDARNSLLYSSDWPHWDFDTPATVFDLPFLDDGTKRRILGLNAKELFRL